MKYYAINEEAARRAKEANSFSDYKEGSTTAEYQAMVDLAYELAEAIKAKIDPLHHAKVNFLVDTYARKLANNFNDRSAIDARVPSILVTGGGNFPVRKKEKQNAARDRNMSEYKEIESLLNKMHSVGKAGISSNDPEAISKLEDKLSRLEHLQEMMKAVNAYYRKYKTLEECPNISPEQIQELKSSMVNDFHPEGKPYERFALTNNNSEIRRLKIRIKSLKQKQEVDYSGWAFTGGNVEVNNEANRLQIRFDEKPSYEQIQLLKKRGFKWAPSKGAWQRQLTSNAMYSAKTLDFIQPHHRCVRDKVLLLQ